MADLEKFNQYLALESQLANIATKKDLIECARLLAINLAHYELTFGSLPLDETLAVLETDQPNEEQIKMLNRGMENFVGVLGNIVQGFDARSVS